MLLMCLCSTSLQTGIHRHVGINVVYFDGRLKTNGVSNDILKTQKVDGSTIYDALDLSFNIVDTTNI